ncbi:hypothetical protein GYMLUDRAFT_246852 [Collybiopsis luxurians FD-317 M1]|uniref:Uncharacterized protein n=1 Tax=Collybiopsis luxurians FD-317 M1 TaxID=944289 RepID=A0A0D0CQ54_9AGAR|nr:hypothetical protein GYMLUDRAFT_246852 [Collybiopsis luxurians FD-317 M1]
MTPEEHQTIASCATDIFLNIVVGIIVSVTGYGISVLGLFIATRILVAKSWTHSQVTLFICLIITFVALTWAIFVNVAFPLILGQVVFGKIKPEVRGELDAQAQILNSKILPLNYMANWPLTISAILSDFIVVWRAWALFQQEKLWKVALVLLMIVNIGTQIANCILDNIDVQVVESKPYTILDWLSIVISLVVNMFATGLIAWKAWQVT